MVAETSAVFEGRTTYFHLLAANPEADVETSFLKIKDLRELI